MSYVLARAKLVSIVEGVTPTLNTLFATGFRHLPEGRSGIQCTSRSFWLEADTDSEGGIPGPYTPDIPSGQPRARTPITLTVSYRFHERRNVLDEMLVTDRLDISKALLTQGNWDGATTGILSVSASPEFMTTRRSPVEGGIEQRITFPLLFR